MGNPLLVQLNEANKTACEVSSQLESYQPLLEVVCPQWTRTQLPQFQEDLQETESRLADAKKLLSPETIYPYYNQLAESGCQGTVRGVSWLVVSQALTGLLLLPALTIMTERFLDRWSRWAKQEERQRLRMELRRS